MTYIDPSSSMEERLRAALAAQAEEVTEETLTEQVMPWHVLAPETAGAIAGTHESTAEILSLSVGPSRSLPKMARQTWLVAAAAVVLLAVGGTTVAIQHSSTQKMSALPIVRTTPGPSPESDRPDGQPSTPLPGSANVSHVPEEVPGGAVSLPLSLGDEASSAGIPWDQVGSGWSLVLASAEDPGNGSGNSAALFVVSPVGGRYRVPTTQAVTSVVAWSPDSRRAIVGDVDSKTLEIDLTTGKPTTGHRFEPQLQFVSYTRPKGTAVVAVDQGAMSTALQRFGLDGAVQATYPTEAPDVGQLSAHSLMTPDGAKLVAQAITGLGVLATTGSVISTIAWPVGTQSCTLVRWWRPQAALAECGSSSPSSGSGTPGTDSLWSLPIDGTTPTRIVTSPADRTYVSAFTSRHGTVVSSANAPCGELPVGILGANGYTQFKVKNQPTDVTYGLVGVTQDLATLTTATCTASDSAGALMSYDIASGKATVLVGKGMGGTVLYALPNPADQ